MAVITLISFSAVFPTFQRTSTLDLQYKSYEAARFSIDFVYSVKQLLEKVKPAYDQSETKLALVPAHSSFPFLHQCLSPSILLCFCRLHRSWKASQLSHCSWNASILRLSFDEERNHLSLPSTQGVYSVNGVQITGGDDSGGSLRNQVLFRPAFRDSAPAATSSPATSNQMWHTYPSKAPCRPYDLGGWWCPLGLWRHLGPGQCLGRCLVSWPYSSQDMMW